MRLLLTWESGRPDKRLETVALCRAIAFQVEEPESSLRAA